MIDNTTQSPPSTNGTASGRGCQSLRSRSYLYNEDTFPPGRSSSSVTSATSVTSETSVPSVSPETKAALASISAKSLRTGLIFDFARRLWSLPEIRGVQVHDLRGAVGRFHDLAVTNGVLERDFLGCWVEFADAWARMRFRDPTKVIEEAVKAASVDDLPPVADPYLPGVRRLLAICRELQRLHGENPFFLSCRQGAEVSGTSPATAARWLRGFVLDGILELVKPGQSWRGGRAARYRYKPTDQWQDVNVGVCDE